MNLEVFCCFRENPLYIGQTSLATRRTPQNPLTPWFPEVPRQNEDEQSGTQVKAGSQALTSYCPMGTGKPSLNSSQGQLLLDVVKTSARLGMAADWQRTNGLDKWVAWRFLILCAVEISVGQTSLPLPSSR